MGDFVAVVRGMADACRAFGIPVTGGNVSFYNESPQGAVHPTPVVGMLGVLDDVSAHRPTMAREGETIVLLGQTRPELGGSEALSLIHDTVAGSPPALDLLAETALTRLLADASIGSHAHDLSEGGLGVALAEIVIRSGCGARVSLPDGTEPLWGLFGESTARAIVTCAPDDVDRVLASGVPASVIGRMQGRYLDVEGVLRASVDDLRAPYDDAIPSVMDR
jgi:phosphoribosylformylglycinamidine synthase